LPDNNAVVRPCGVVGFCAIRPPVNCDCGGLTVTVEVARGLTRPLVVDVNLDAVTANALTVVGVRVCRCVAVTVVVLACGVPPVACVVVVEDRLLPDEPDDPPDEPDDPPDEPDDPPDEPDDPPDEPDDPPDEPDDPRDPLDDPPAPADPVPERRAILSAPR